MLFLLLGDYKSPIFIGRTFFTADFKSAGTPGGRLSGEFENLRHLRNLRDSFKRPNRSKKQGEEWVKSGEEVSQLFTLANTFHTAIYTTSVKSEE